MPLNIGASGSIKPYAKYNSKADKWFARGDAGDIEIGRPTFVADLANICTGWMCLREGQPPEKVIDPSLDRVAPSPGEGFKRGFVVMVFSQTFFGGAVELASASIHMGNAIREVYQAYEEQRDHQSQPAAGDRLRRLRADEGQVRHQLQAEAGDRQMGRPAGGAAGPEPGRGRRHLAGRAGIHRQTAGKARAAAGAEARHRSPARSRILAETGGRWRRRLPRLHESRPRCPMPLSSR